MTGVNELSERQKRILNEVLQELEGAVSVPKARLKLDAQSNSGNIQLANPHLQPIAFAIRHANGWTNVDGAIGVISALMVLIGSILFWLFAFIIMLALARTAYIGIVEKLQRVVQRFVREGWTVQRRWDDACKRLCNDERAPILYLRSFCLDPTYDPPMWDPRRVDERLAAFYEKYGPMIGVAGPHDKGPLLGPVRLYFDDDIWRAGIIYLMSISQFVIVQAGTSQGTLWELGMARQILKPNQLVISLADTSNPNVADKFYDDFKPYAEAILGCELPERLDSSVYLGFGKNWEPLLQGSQGKWLPTKTSDDLFIELVLTHEQSARGVALDIEVPRRETCKDCKGDNTAFSIPLRSFLNCITCCGRKRVETMFKFTVKIPPGISDGQWIRSKGHGHSGLNNSESGDLKIIVSTKPKV